MASIGLCRGPVRKVGSCRQRFGEPRGLALRTDQPARLDVAMRGPDLIDEVRQAPGAGPGPESPDTEGMARLAASQLRRVRRIVDAAVALAEEDPGVVEGVEIVGLDQQVGALEVARDAVEDRGRDHRIAEHGTPFADRAVAGDQQAGSLVAVGEDLEQQFRAGAAERQVTQFVADQQVGLDRQRVETTTTRPDAAFVFDGRCGNETVGLIWDASTSMT